LFYLIKHGPKKCNSYVAYYLEIIWLRNLFPKSLSN
jgi:hypothetical protein